MTRKQVRHTIHERRDAEALVAAFADLEWPFEFDDDFYFEGPHIDYAHLGFGDYDFAARRVFEQMQRRAPLRVPLREMLR